MAKAFKVPELGENIESATVAKVVVSEGDQVEKDQTVVELETDKTVAEVPCDVSGKVTKVHVKEGDEVKVGDPLISFGDGAAKDDTSEDDASGEPDGKEAGGEDQAEPPESDEPSDEQQDAAAKKSAEEDDAEDEPRSAEKKKTGEEPPPEPRQPDDDDGEDDGDGDGENAVPAAPSVRRFAREIGVDITAVSGSGPHGRVSRDDVKAHARSRRDTPRGSSAAVPPLPDFSKWGPTEREPMSKVRRLTAERMSLASTVIPQAVQMGKADVTAIENMRNDFKDEVKQAGGHLSLTVLLIKAMAAALKAFPRFNASVDAEANEIVYKKFFHIGVAMDTERGLVVPVVRNVDSKRLIDVAVDLARLTEKARDGKLAMDDLQGGSITITNAGALGADTFIPIVNWPEVAILAVARTRTEPVFINGDFEPRQMLPLALSYDHRIVDGADGVRFLQRIIDALECPIRMM